MTRCAYFSLHSYLGEDLRGQAGASATILSGISAQMDVELVYLNTNDDVESVKAQLRRKFPLLKALHVITIPQTASVFKRLYYGGRLLPLSLASLARTDIKRVVSSIHNDPNVDIVHYDLMPWMIVHPCDGQYAKPTICSGTDAYSLAYLGKMKYEGSLLLRARDRMAALSFSRFERRYLRRADVVHLFSHRDVEYLRFHGLKVSFLQTNLPLDDKWFVSTSSWDPDKRGKRILLTGQHTHSWYLKGVSKFLERIWPAISRRHKDASLTIQSSHLSSQIESIAEMSERVRNVGYVQDYKRLFSEHDYFVHPLLTGTGQKTRLVNAMSQGLCCIATDEAVSGMELRPNVDYVPLELGDRIEQDSSRLCELLDHQNIAAEIALSGWTKARKNFSKRVVCEQIIDAYHKVLNGD